MKSIRDHYTLVSWGSWRRRWRIAPSWVQLSFTVFTLISYGGPKHVKSQLSYDYIRAWAWINTTCFANMCRGRGAESCSQRLHLKFAWWNTIISGTDFPSVLIEKHCVLHKQRWYDRYGRSCLEKWLNEGRFQQRNYSLALPFRGRSSFPKVMLMFTKQQEYSLPVGEPIVPPLVSFVFKSLFRCAPRDNTKSQYKKLTCTVDTVKWLEVQTAAEWAFC